MKGHAHGLWIESGDDLDLVLLTEIEAHLPEFL
jgi:hypothetical protein